METLKTCSSFLQEALNNHSAVVLSETMKLFLSKFSSLAQMSNCEVRVKVKPNGIKCLACGKLVKRSDASKAIIFYCNPSEHLMCSAQCLRSHSLFCTNNSLFDLHNVTCPVCQVPIQPDLIHEAFDHKIEMLQNDACDRALNNLLNEEEKKELVAKFQCEICYNHYKVTDGITLECDHRFCSTCINQLCVSNIESGQVSEKSMSCPQCQTLMTMYEIQDIVGDELFQKFQKFLLRGFKVAEDDPNTKIFNCPGLDCEFFCMYEVGIENIECPKCFLVTCPKCSQKAHQGMTCEEFKVSRNVDQSDLMLERLLVQEGIIRCPSCGTPVQRISGCEFMVCSSSVCQSKTYFCYDCGKKLERDHEIHNCDKSLRMAPQQRIDIGRNRPNRRLNPRRVPGFRNLFGRRGKK
jgi:hypothetical protein